jgi:hypothetical protein
MRILNFISIEELGARTGQMLYFPENALQSFLCSLKFAKVIGATVTYVLSAEARDLSLLHSFQNGSGAHPVQWVLGIKRVGRELTTNVRLVPRSRTVELYLYSPIHLNGMVLN